ncbi:MAG TPA: hypothetical protein PL124_11115, partial [Candidatus Cloacimonadota bacterium]|nr:hypothetical protein [Candidatus Cloacimonadota bacterium]
MSKKYIYNGRVANVEDWAEAQFRKDYPGAKLATAYTVDGRKATVPIDERSSFLSQYPHAIEVGAYNPANDPMRKRVQPTAQETADKLGDPESPNFEQAAGAALKTRVGRMESDQAAVTRGNKGIPTLSQGSQVMTVQKSDQFDEAQARIDATNANLTLSDPMKAFQPGAYEDAYKTKREAEPVIKAAEEERTVNYWNEQPGKLKDEYEMLDQEAVTLSERRGSWNDKDADRYSKIVNRLGEIETEYPAAAVRMTRRQFDNFQAGRDLIKESPFLSYLDALGTGTISLIASPVTMVTPGSGLSDFLTYGEKGVSSEGTTLGNMFRSTLASLPMSIATMINPEIGFLLTTTNITSQNIKGYYDERTLDAEALIASTISGIAQGIIEVAATGSQMKGYRSVFQNGGQEALEQTVKNDLREMFKPTTGRVLGSLLKGAHIEGMEEVYQNLTDKVTRMVINGEEMPDLGTLVNELALDYAGGAFGGALLGGGANTVNLITNKNMMSAVENLAQTT